MKYFTTKLYITSTSLDLEKVNMIVFNTLETGEKFDINNIEYITQNYNSKVNQGIIVEPKFEKKEDFKEILSSIYQQYSSKTYLFLGDINSYSIQLQEGLLKLIEEPPANLQIIIYSQNTNNILPTIKSRSIIKPLSEEIIGFCLDQEILRKVKEFFPSPLEFSKEYVSSSASHLNSNQIDLKKIERMELNMWLWQVLFCLKQIYKANNGSRIIASRIQSVIISIDLNNNNIQKKLAFEFLFI